MRVTIPHIEAGLMSYIDQEFVQKLTGLNQWLVMGAAGLLSGKLESISQEMLRSPLAKQLELVDDAGYIDIDKIKTAFDAAADKTGAVVQNIPLLGPVTFSKDDIQKLYTHIGKAAGMM